MGWIKHPVHVTTQVGPISVSTGSHRTMDLEFDTDGSSYDTSIYILDQCNGSELACNDDSIFGTQSYSYDVSAGEDYILVVDGYSSSSQGDYIMDLVFTPRYLM